MATVQEGYSAAVEIYLEVAGRRLSAHHVDRDGIDLREPFPLDLPLLDMHVVIVIDGREFRTPVRKISVPGENQRLVKFPARSARG